MKGISELMLIGLAVLTSSCVSGCAMIQAGSQAHTTCTTAPVLYTDLTQVPQKRIYQLEGGQNCTDFYQRGQGA